MDERDQPTGEDNLPPWINAIPKGQNIVSTGHCTVETKTDAANPTTIQIMVAKLKTKGPIELCDRMWNEVCGLAYTAQTYFRQTETTNSQQPRLSRQDEDFLTYFKSWITRLGKTPFNTAKKELDRTESLMWQLIYLSRMREKIWVHSDQEQEDLKKLAKDLYLLDEVP